MQAPNPKKLIIRPEKPLCDGAMYSPGFFPKGYLCKPFNGGYDMVQALAARYDFDPAATPWNRMSPEAQHAFLYGDPEPLTVCQFCHPPVTGIVVEATSVPVGLSSRNSRLPPVPALARRALTFGRPVPKSRLL